MGHGMMGHDTRGDAPHDDDDFDDLPSTHLDDEAYETFLATEMDREGRLREAPPVGRVLAAIVVVLLIVALLLFG
jgi:hypothetical protein